MYCTLRTSVVVVISLFTAASLRAQTAVDPSGHWEGLVQAPGMDIAFQIDFAKSGSGITGAVSVPAQQLTGLPLQKVVVDGRSIKFQARTDQSFDGTMSDDGGSISGSYYIDGAAVPFTMTRKGEARIAAPITGGRIGKELEGRWNGTIDVSGGLKLVLTMTNHADGTSTGALVNRGEGGLEIPVRITQDGARVTLDVPALGGSYAGMLNENATELTGTYSQGGRSAPLIFKHAAGDDRR